MKIISHRGYWHSHSEKNSKISFERSFQLGVGTETDVRDSLGELVISHDMPSGGEQRLIDFLDCAKKFSTENSKLTLALNVKADGIAHSMVKQLRNYPQLDCFVFDMSVPDMRNYISSGISFFTRMSEVERTPAFLESATGVWLDSFESEWFDEGIIKNILNLGRRVCIVSAELHGRDPAAQWKKLLNLAEHDDVILCTDNPEQAIKYFQ